jgi:UDP-GlcNAc:undecaprenyl-phosphate GlcNAc-1-phosphate transferase
LKIHDNEEKVMKESLPYLFAFISALIASFSLVPIFRSFAIKLNVFDNPSSNIKTHKISTPYFGGLAIISSWFLSLFLIRSITSFPNLTLRNLRGIICGSLILCLLGLIDDIKLKGLGFKSKLLIQFLAASIVVFCFGIRIEFIYIYWLSCLVSIIWIVGVTNAFNIIDIMDGLSSGIAVIAAFAFFFISIPTKMFYVNFCSIALAGAILGFLPFNFSKSKKIFMGDAGSLFVGFVMASLAMGTSYSSINNFGVFTPLFILAIPIYETILVSICRIRKGKLPFLGSKDHYALRLEKMGFSRKKILVITYVTSIFFSVCAYLVTTLTPACSLILFISLIVIMCGLSITLTSVKVD